MTDKTAPMQDTAQELREPLGLTTSYQPTPWTQGRNPVSGHDDMKSTDSPVMTPYHSVCGKSDSSSDKASLHSSQSTKSTSSTSGGISQKSSSSGRSSTVYISSSSLMHEAEAPSAPGTVAAVRARSSSNNETSPVATKPGAFYTTALSRFATDVTAAGMARLQYLDGVSPSASTGSEHGPPELLSQSYSGEAAARSSSTEPAAGSGRVTAASSSTRRSMSNIPDAKRSWSQVSIVGAGGSSATAAATGDAAARPAPAAASLAAAAATIPEGSSTEAPPTDKPQSPPRTAKPIMAGTAVSRTKSAAGVVSTSWARLRQSFGSSSGSTAGGAKGGSSSSTAGISSSIGGKASSTLGGSSSSSSSSKGDRRSSISSFPLDSSSSTMGGSSTIGGSTIGGYGSTIGGKGSISGYGSTFGGHGSTAGGSTSTLGGYATSSSTVAGYSTAASTLGGSSTAGGSSMGYGRGYDSSIGGQQLSSLGGQHAGSSSSGLPPHPAEYRSPRSPSPLGGGLTEPQPSSPGFLRELTPHIVLSPKAGGSSSPFARVAAGSPPPGWGSTSAPGSSATAGSSTAGAGAGFSSSLPGAKPHWQPTPQSLPGRASSSSTSGGRQHPPLAKSAGAGVSGSWIQNLRSGAAAAAAGFGRATSGSGWSSRGSSVSGARTRSCELPASEAEAAAAAAAAGSPEPPMSYAESVRRMAAESRGTLDKYLMKRSRSGSDRKGTRSESISPSQQTLDKSRSRYGSTRSEPNNPDRTTLDRSGAYLADLGEITPTQETPAAESEQSAAVAAVAAAAAAAILRNAGSMIGGSSTKTSSTDSLSTSVAAVAGSTSTAHDERTSAAAAAAADLSSPQSPVLWINTGRSPMKSIMGARGSEASDGGDGTPERFFSPVTAAAESPVAAAVAAESAPRSLDLTSKDADSAPGAADSAHEISRGSRGSPRAASAGGSSTKETGSRRRSYIAVYLGKLGDSKCGPCGTKRGFLGKLVLPLLLLAAIIATAIATGVLVGRERAASAARANAAAAAAAAADSRAMAAALDVHSLPFRIDMKVPAVNATEACENWFGHSERVIAYRRTFAAAYNAVLKSPFPESAVTNIVCNNKTMFNITDEPPPKEPTPARHLLSIPLEAYDILNGSHRIMLQMQAADPGMEFVHVTTRFLVPAPSDMAERLSIVETVKTQSATVLAGPLEKFFGTPTTWPAGEGAWSDVFSVDDTLAAAAARNVTARNRSVTAKPKKEPTLTFQVVIAVPAVDEKQACAAWFGSSERIEQYNTLFSQAFSGPLNIPPDEVVIRTVSCGNETVYLASTNDITRSSSSRADQAAKPSRLLLESSSSAAAGARRQLLQSAGQSAGDALTLVEIVTRFSIPAPGGKVSKEQMAQVVTTQATKMLSGPLSQFFSVSRTVVETRPMSPKPNPNMSGLSFNAAPTCQFQPTRSNSVADSQGRLWSMQDGKECVFRAQKGPKTAPKKFTWEDAPSCVGQPTQSNSVRDENNRLWGWQAGQSCVFRDQGQTQAGAAAAGAAAANRGKKAGKSKVKVGVVWEAAPSCSVAPTAENSEADTFGRLWGWENDNSCAFRWNSLPA